MLHKILLRKNQGYLAKINPQTILWFCFCNIIFCIKFFCITIAYVTNICTFIFDGKKTTHAEINEQNFVTQKMLMQNFLSQKNACKNKSSKIFDFIIRGHNDKGLELCGREDTGASFPSPTRGLISELLPYYRLPYILKHLY